MNRRTYTYFDEWQNGIIHKKKYGRIFILFYWMPFGLRCTVKFHRSCSHYLVEFLNIYFEYFLHHFTVQYHVYFLIAQVNLHLQND